MAYAAETVLNVMPILYNAVFFVKTKHHWWKLFAKFSMA